MSRKRLGISSNTAIGRQVVDSKRQVNGWAAVLADEEAELRLTKKKEADLKLAIVAFKQRVEAGDPFPGEATHPDGNAPIGVASKWFPDRRGLVVGIMVTSFGGGSAILDPLCRVAAVSAASRGRPNQPLWTLYLLSNAFTFRMFPPRDPGEPKRTVDVASFAQLGGR